MKIPVSLVLISCAANAALAGPVEVEEYLNGLPIETRTIGTEQSDDGGVGTLKVLEVINRGDVGVTCELAPGSTDTLVPPSGPTPIGAGEQIGLRLAGSHTPRPVRARLTCTQDS